jgi:hypothetical protein
MDTGWTRWLLDNFKVPHTALRNADFAGADLRSKYDCIILAAQGASSILHGIRLGERSASTAVRGPLTPPQQRPEYTGGIGLAGLVALDRFVREGGWLLALDAASDLSVANFPLPVRNTMSGFSSPGSILRIAVDTSNPLATGMPAEAYAFSNGGQAWDISLLPEYNKGDSEVRSVARYAKSNLLASGWISGERVVADKHIMLEARHGKGRVVLYGFRPQFRGQTFGTFKLVLNPIYLASAAE